MSRARQIAIPIALFVVVFILWVCYQNWTLDRYQSITERGQYGDMFGGLTSLFTGWAFAGVIWTIWLQHRQLAAQIEELGLQRRELELTRKELNRSAQAQEGTEDALRNQVRVAALSARLAVLPSLIRNEELFLQETSDFSTISSTTLDEVQRILKNQQQKVHRGEQLSPREVQNIEYLRRLVDFRRQQQEIHDKLRELGPLET